MLYTTLSLCYRVTNSRLLSVIFSYLLLFRLFFLFLNFWLPYNFFIHAGISICFPSLFLSLSLSLSSLSNIQYSSLLLLLSCILILLLHACRMNVWHLVEQQYRTAAAMEVAVDSCFPFVKHMWFWLFLTNFTCCVLSGLYRVRQIPFFGKCFKWKPQNIFSNFLPEFALV